MFVVVLCFIIMIFSFILSENGIEREKMTTYECGFNPINKNNNIISIKFFIVSIIFLVFDLEIILLFPWSPTLMNGLIENNSIYIIFINILLLGLVYEWFQGGLTWE